MNRSGKKYLEVDRTHGGGSQLVALHHPVEGLSLLPLSGGGPLRTRHAAQTETLEVLVRHGLDDGLAEGNHVGPEVRGPAIPLVTIEPGKRDKKLRNEIREYENAESIRGNKTTYPAVRSGSSPIGRPALEVG